MGLNNLCSCWPGWVLWLAWLCTPGGSREALRQMSHRTGTRGETNPEMHVSQIMNEAVPRSHFLSYEWHIVQKLSPEVKTLED